MKNMANQIPLITIRQKAKLKYGGKGSISRQLDKWKVMVDAMVPNGNRDNTIITINMQPLLRNDNKKKTKVLWNGWTREESTPKKNPLSIE